MNLSTPLLLLLTCQLTAASLPPEKPKQALSKEDQQFRQQMLEGLRSMNEQELANCIFGYFEDRRGRGAKFLAFFREDSYDRAQRVLCPEDLAAVIKERGLDVNALREPGPRGELLVDLFFPKQAARYLEFLRVSNAKFNAATLWCAVYDCDYMLARLLLATDKYDVNASSALWGTLLHTAIEALWRKRPGMLPVFVESQFNARREQTVQELLDAGADTTICDNKGRTPLALATELKLPKVIARITEADENRKKFTPTAEKIVANTTKLIQDLRALVLAYAYDPSEIARLSGKTKWALITK